MKRSKLFTIIASVLIVAAIVGGIFILISTNGTNDDDSSISVSQSEVGADQEYLTPDMDESEVEAKEDSYIREGGRVTQNDTTSNDSSTASGAGGTSSAGRSQVSSGIATGNTNNTNGGSTDTTSDSNSTTPYNPPNNNDDNDDIDNKADNNKEDINKDKESDEVEVEYCRAGARCRDENCSICHPINVISLGKTVKFNPKEHTLDSLFGSLIQSKDDVDIDALNLSIHHKEKDTDVQVATASLVISEAGAGWEKGMPKNVGNYDLLIFFNIGDGERNSISLSIEIEKAPIVLDFSHIDDEILFEHKKVGDVIDIAEAMPDFLFHEEVEFRIKWYVSDDENTDEIEECRNSTEYIVRQEDAGKVISVLVVCPKEKNFEGLHIFDTLKIPFRIDVSVSDKYEPMENDSVWVDGNEEASTTYANAGESVTIGYSLDTIYSSPKYSYGLKDTLAWNGGSNLESITNYDHSFKFTETIKGTATYTVDASDAKNGVISIEAEFMHTGISIMPSHDIYFSNLTCGYTQQEKTFKISQLGNTPTGQIEIVQLDANPSDPAAIVITPTKIKSIDIGGSEDITVSTVPELYPDTASPKDIMTHWGILLNKKQVTTLWIDLYVKHDFVYEYNGNGTHSLICKGCDYKEDPIDCDGEWVVASEPKCLEDGEKTMYCGTCGTTHARSIPALEHKWSEWQITTPASCEKKGENARACYRCDDKETESTEALGHDMIVTVSATCVEAGFVNSKCQRDGCDHRTNEAIAALGHDYVDGVCTRCKIYNMPEPNTPSSNYTVKWTMIANDYPNDQNIIATATITLTHSNTSLFSQSPGTGRLYVDGVQAWSGTITRNGVTTITISLKTTNKELIDGNFIFDLRLTATPLIGSAANVFRDTITVPLPTHSVSSYVGAYTCVDPCECEGCIGTGDGATSNCIFCTEECTCLVECPELCDCKTEEENFVDGKGDGDEEMEPDDEYDSGDEIAKT